MSKGNSKLGSNGNSESENVIYYGAKAGESRKAFKVGEVIKGKFSGKYSVPSKYQPGKEMVTYYLETDNGKIGLNNCGDLGDFMDEIEEGSEIAVELTEISKSKKGFDFRRFNVTAN